MARPENEMEALKAQVAALTARVYALEQKGSVTSDAPRQDIPAEQLQPIAPPPDGTMLQPPSAPSVSNPLPIVSAPLAQEPRPPVRLSMPAASGTARADNDLEKKIGQYWLNRIGIVAMLIGVSYFLKYAFDNNWVGPGGRIAIGLLVGIGLVLWSERFRRRGYAVFSYSLKAVGIGTLYLSLWGAYQIYHLVPAGAAFGAMAIVTAATIALALSQHAE